MSDLSKKKKRKCWLGENTGPAFNSNKTEKGGGGGNLRGPLWIQVT